jgi:transcriptional regulator with XRE-family HTH domain
VQITQDPLLLNFGARVRELRALAGLSQDDLAESAGLFRTYMSRIETGRANPTVTVAIKLALALGVTVGALFEAPSQLQLSKTRSVRAVSRGRVC